MKAVGRVCVLTTILVAACLVMSASFAQEQGGGGGERQGRRGGERGDRGDRPNFDPAQMMQREMQRFQERLDLKDDEWKAVQPLIQTVFEKQRDERMFGFAGRRPGGPMGGPGGPPEGGPEGRNRDRGGMFGPPVPEVEALQKALDVKETSNEDVQAKLKEFRAARDKKTADLKDARDKLRAVLTPRQEALCVLMGLLD